MTAPARPASKTKLRRAPTVLPGQLDLFGGIEPASVGETPSTAAPPPKPTPKIEAKRKPPSRGPRNDKLANSATTSPSAPAPPAVTAPMQHPSAKLAPASTDEWWTTRIVCAFLKISRKTLWERRRDKGLGFPSPLHLGSARNLYRASAVRAWAERMAADRRTA